MFVNYLSSCLSWWNQHFREQEDFLKCCTVTLWSKPSLSSIRGSEVVLSFLSAGGAEGAVGGNEERAQTGTWTFHMNIIKNSLTMCPQLITFTLSFLRTYLQILPFWILCTFTDFLQTFTNLKYACTIGESFLLTHLQIIQQQKSFFLYVSTEIYITVDQM